MAIIPFVFDSSTTSNAKQISDYKVFALQFPTMAGATITFEGGESRDGTFVKIVDEAGVTIQITATDDSIVGLDAAALEIAAVEWLKLVSASSENITVLMHAKK